MNDRGIPQAPPTLVNTEEPGIVRHLSLFDFWPVGVVLPSTCAGDSDSVSWEDDGRPRSIRYTIVDSRAESVRLRIEMRRGSWHLDGTLEVNLSDGLTGEVRLHEVGPGAPKINDNERVIRVWSD